MRMRSILAVAALGGVLACSPSATRAPAPGPTEAGVPDAGGSDAPRDAYLDTRPADAEPPKDAASLDARPGDAGPWCLGQGIHLFCDDFDEAPLASAWDTFQEEQGTVRLNDASYTSPFESYLASATSLGQGGVAGVYMSKAVTYPATQMHWAFDVRPDALDPNGVPVVVSSLQMVDTSGDILETITLSLGATSASVTDLAIGVDSGIEWTATHPLVPPPAVGQWTRIKIDILLPEYAAGIGTGTLTVHVGSGPTPAVDHAAMSPASQPSLPYMMLGIVFELGPAEPAAVRFDDVTFDVQP